MADLGSVNALTVPAAYPVTNMTTLTTGLPLGPATYGGVVISAMPITAYHIAGTLTPTITIIGPNIPTAGQLFPRGNVQNIA